MQIGSMVLAFLVGMGLVVQVGLNMAVARSLGGAPVAALVNFLVGTVALSLMLLIARPDWPAREQLGAVPWWAWMGGLLGALYVATATFAGPRIGALLLLALTFSGQLIGSMLVDHFGLLGFQQQSIGLQKLLGVAMLCVGVILIAR
ncbi:MAG: DMT family transporter [Steroidobacteraceae bacterium]|jgi:transporter family-2 protein